MRQTESSIRISRQEDHTVIILQGPLDHELAGNLVPLVGKVMPPVVFDMKQVPYTTAAGSRIILGYFQNFGQPPLLRNANRAIRDLLTLTGTIQYVRLEEDAPVTDIT